MITSTVMVGAAALCGLTDHERWGYIDFYVAPERLKHGEKIEEVGDQAPPSAQPTLIEQMREKLT